MNFGPQEACQDSTCPPSLFLETWWTWRFLIHLGMVSDGKRKSKRSFPESFMKIGHQKLCQDSTCHPSLLLESLRTWRSLMNWYMVSCGSKYLSESSVKVSSRSDIRNHVKTMSLFQCILVRTNEQTENAFYLY